MTSHSLGGRALIGLIPLLALIALCIPFLNNPLIFDDRPFFAIGTPEQIVEAGIHLSPRWWVYATHAFTFVHIGPEVIWQRIANLAAHVGAAVALYFLVRQLILDLDKARGLVWRADGIALLAATLFALHPIAIFTQGYLIQRTSVCSTLFVILSWLGLWVGMKGSRLALWGSVMAYLIAVLSKEHAIMAPAIGVLMLALFLRSNLQLRIRPGELGFAMFIQALIGLMILLQVKSIIGSPYEPLTTEMMDDGTTVASQIVYPLSILNQAGLFFRYLMLWLLPNSGSIAIDIRTPFPDTFESTTLWLGMVLFLAYGALSARLLFMGGTKGLAGLSLLGPWVMFFTEFAAVRLQEPFVLYRSYLWVPFLFILLALGMRRLSRSLLLMIAPLILLYCAALSYDRLTVLSHSYLAWNEAAELLERTGINENTYGAYRIYFNRGIALYDEGMMDGSKNDMERVLALKPGFAAAYQQLGVIHSDKKEWAEARKHFENAINAHPEGFRSYFGRATALEHLGEFGEARATYAAACILGSVAGCEKAGIDPDSAAKINASR